MNTYFKTSLLASASAFALVAVSMSPASAFDRVNWQWDAQIDETVTKTVNIDIDLAPSGMVMLEDLQMSIGDITATSTVSGIDNNQPLSENQLGAGPQDILFYYENDGSQFDTDDTTPGVSDGQVEEAFFDPEQELISGRVTLTFDIGELEGAELDAVTELPEVVSAATAVANNTSITTDAAIQLHEGQFAFGDGGEINGDIGSGGEGGENGDRIENSNLEILAGLLGNVDSAQISATSSVSDILNASVDSSATAVANNLSVSLEPAGTDNAVMIADVVQFSYADVLATSTVQDVSLNNYTNLGGIDRPIVNSVATAVGNNKTINVGAPSPTVSVE